MRCLEKEPQNRPKSAVELLRMMDSPDVASGDFIAPARSTWTRGRVVGWSTVGLLSVAAVATTFWPSSNRASPPPVVSTPVLSARSIAIAPFVAASGDSLTRTVALGLTSQVTNALAGVAGLRVAGSDTQGARTVATESFRLEATVQRERERVRVLPRLIATATDSTVWVGSFDGNTGALFALQDSVSQMIVRAVTDRVRR
ncbi:MAG: hypothetical protein U0163_15125 [Gemmatimonadaceae bacterium]